MQLAPTISIQRQVLLAVALNTVIALTLSLLDNKSVFINLVYSQCIGLSIWLLVAVSQAWLIRDWERDRTRLVVLVPVCVVLGYALGAMAADLLLHTDSLGYWKQYPRQSLGLLIMSLCAGIAVTYFLASRSQLAAERQRVEAATRQVTESRLKLLESQLEPHMLFNTLANLRMLISIDPARAQTMLDHLIAYLRATLSASRTTAHTLEQEFERLRDYLELMQVRMGPRLQFSLDLPEELRQTSVPALLLQPLVENSIQHGLEPKVEGGRIAIAAQRDGNTLCLEVVDTGLGLNPATLPHEGKGFGLAQVRERLATLYGSNGTLNLIATHAGGTRARVTFPINP
jgi:LytS/YehU family sensor histidine kinase